MSENMVAELEYLFAMMLCGSVVAFCYHMVLIFRTILYHSKAVVDAEDILFLSASGFYFFIITYEKNSGILRWYAIAGFIIGIYFYLGSIGKVLELVRKSLLQKLKKPFKIKIVLQQKQHKKKNSKGRVSESEGCNPEREKKSKKEKRS